MYIWKKKLLDEIKGYYLEINSSDVKTMIFNYQYINSKYPKTIASINNTPVESTTILKYPGCNIKYDEPSTGDLELEPYKFYELGGK